MRRGEICWVRFPQPAVLVSRDEAYSVRTRVTVVPVTRTVRGIPTEVRLGPADGLPKAGAANADEIVTVPRNLVDRRIAGRTRAKLAELDDAIRYALGLS